MYYKILYKYPSATDNDFELRDNSDGKGTHIVKWNEDKLGPAPTRAELDAVVKDEKFNSMVAKIKLNMAARAIAVRESHEPGDPPIGSMVRWLDAATGNYMIKINHGGVIKTAVLVEFAAMSNNGQAKGEEEIK